jgi:hypothetical protein
MEGKGEGGRSRSSLLPWKPKGRVYLEEREQREFQRIQRDKFPKITLECLEKVLYFTSIWHGKYIKHFIAICVT